MNRLTVLPVVLLSFLACKDSPAPAALPAPLAAPVPAHAPAAPKAAGECAMCGMDVSMHPEWAGRIELADGSVHQTCSVRCTLATAIHAKKFLGVEPGEIRKIQVPDYLHPGTVLDAAGALFVADSDVRGPMGVEPVPAVNEADAQVVTSRHGGRVLKHAEVTPELLMNLKQHGKSTP